ncbi:hypothetical protein N752_20695 [Desulforamulus aquiferis]|nr:hypothetical protein [Desulforamulus aquiferis]RYD03253.1 hypothetical protein N752_20695 [Desulforamulus aquiferis]
MGVQLVQMTVDHIPGVLEIEQVSFPTPWSQQAFTYEILSNNLPIIWWQRNRIR